MQECEADKLDDGHRAHFPHQMPTMHVDRSAAHSELMGDLLGRLSRDDQMQDLSLARRQAGDARLNVGAIGSWRADALV